MWGTLLVVTLLCGTNPMRLGITLLLISRPRPMQNLLACWVGSLTVSVPVMGVTLALLHVHPTLRSIAQDWYDWVTSSAGRHIQIGSGVLALSIVALMTVRSVARRRAQLPTPGGNTSTLVLDSNTPPAISRLSGRAQDAATEGGSAIRRLLRRVHNAWENGSLWVAWVIGVGFAGPLPDEIVLVLAIVVSSGVAIGTQVSAVIAFIVGTLAIVEFTLVSYLATPAKTHAVVQLLHEWALAHRRQVVIAMFAVAGLSLLARGMDIV